MSNRGVALAGAFVCVGAMLLLADALRAEAPAAKEIPVFPGAVGYGVETPAGRGGKVIQVTTRAAAGEGSLAAALAQKGPRTIVFAVGGTIDLDGNSLSLTEPFVTIAGQTAPAPGITIIGGSLKISTHDVLMQHIRVRPGDGNRPRKSGFEPDGISTSNPPNTPGASRIVIDHCSCTWAVDENLTASGQRHQGRDNTSHQITFSNCIVAEGLRNASHGKGKHSMGTLVHDHARDVSIIGNLYACNDNRNPVLKPDAAVAVVNNLIYNPGQRAIHSYWTVNEYRDPNDTMKPMTLVAVGNVLWWGPDTPAGMPMISLAADKGEVYSQDNIALDREGKAALVVGGKPKILKDRPFWPAGLVAMPAKDAAEHVLKHAGAFPACRDAIDSRIIENARKRAGKVIDSQQDVGGYPAGAGTSHKLALPSNPNGDDNRNGYTNLEEWLHKLAAKADSAN